MIRKKSKYKHATIGNKRYYFYKIVWLDPCGDSGHADAAEMKSLTPAKMIHKLMCLQKIIKLFGHLLHMTVMLPYFLIEMLFQKR